jgi:anti-sigma factor RsiW
MPFLVSGTLSEEEKQFLVLHLAACGDCVADLGRVAALRQTLGMRLSALPEPPVRVWAEVKRGTGSAPKQADLRSFILETLVPTVTRACVPKTVASIMEAVVSTERRYVNA